ncbi:hypothetical protein [Psychrobacter sp. FME5]|uniref:hypothetical protein n=1 Tax=Psychrobacter sp. FME5 TaxID=2487706 RepID=UPI001787A921|nr:hypothetical protein [Psychrobacter sp. FME5]MBE0443886.1 hypothetical protein [Psychrobacter sp. FME5]
MKIIRAVLITICLLPLNACLDMNAALQGGGKYLKDDQGRLVGDCRGNNLSMELSISDADTFWQDNNLPKGTYDFVCKDGKAYLPSKVTDCQNNLIAKQSGGVEGFRSKYNLNNGNMRFTCNNGTVTPVPLSS